MALGKILVIDDEVNFRQLFLQTLRKEGYQVQTAENGEEAYHLLQKEPFDLALIDIKMSPIDGFSILERVKKDYPKMKVIMITAFAAIDTETRSLQLGADRFLTKPLEIPELKQAIQLTLVSSK
ncbi:MAG: response regulator [Nitrospirae bacterium]|nr:response regulator [Nitrospirota bacterium]MBI3593621.1 response regulator [Nitrospirota bacterium]